MYIIDGKSYECSVEVTNDIFNDKWKMAIIWHLLEGPKRYKELHEEVCSITQKTLTSKLKELEQKGLLQREVFAEVPPKVIYSLTPIAQELRGVLEQMHAWGIAYAKLKGKIKEEEKAV